MPGRSKKTTTTTAASADPAATTASSDTNANANANAAPATTAKAGTKGRSKKASKSSTSKRSKKTTLAAHPTFRQMILEAIAGSHHAGKGASRSLIANYIKANYKGLSDGAVFNAHLRKALNEGVDKGVLEHGETPQRFKFTASGKYARLKKETKKAGSPKQKKEKQPKRKRHRKRKVPKEK